MEPHGDTRQGGHLVQAGGSRCACAVRPCVAVADPVSGAVVVVKQVGGDDGSGSIVCDIYSPPAISMAFPRRMRCTRPAVGLRCAPTRQPCSMFSCAPGSLKLNSSSLWYVHAVWPYSNQE
jgi:hypothetical protein